MSRISSAHVLAGLALFVALGGTALANDGVRALITGADVRNGSLTGRDVKNRSLTRADLAPNVLRRGPAGPAGAAGPAGVRGPAGPAGPDLAGATHVRVRGDRTPTANGEALRAALASITDASATKPYVILLAPGVYELGATTLAMKAHVSIAGAGATVTRITGDQGQPAFGEGALVVGAHRTLLRDLTLTNRGDAGANYHSVLEVPDRAAMRIEEAVVEAESAVVRGYALTATGGSSVDVRDSRLLSDGDVPSAALAIEGSDLRIRGSELVAIGQGGFGLTARDGGTTAVVENSSIVTDAMALNAAGGTVTVGASRVVGTVSTVGLTCVASYDGSFAPLGAGCS